VVAPATRPERVAEIRKIIGNDLSIISPGVGAQGGSASDVIKAGADWVIVGRAIYQAEDPAMAAKKLVDEMKEFI
jgi:orotidine-5'-phosphate decarboxylase